MGSERKNMSSFAQQEPSSVSDMQQSSVETSSLPPEKHHVGPHFSTQESKAEVKNGAMRLVFAGVSIILQILWIIFFVGYLMFRFPWLGTVISVISLIAVLMIYGRHENANMKLSWMLLIMAFPLLGLTFYLLSGLTGSTPAMKRRFRQIDARLAPFLPSDAEEQQALSAAYPSVAGQSRYLSARAGFPAYQDTKISFFADTPEALESLKADLRSATSFIFMEYYAIENDVIFSQIREILRERAAAGIEVRLFYDDIGSIFFINTDFASEMEKDGIKCRIFNPMLPLTNMFMNHRDHRKITVIDGRIAYTGGYNLANEYFHLTEPYGHWKDTGVRMEGSAARSMTFMFLEIWNAIRGTDVEETDLARFFPAVPAYPVQDGFVQPYGDSPLSFESIGENVYLNVLHNAEQYCYFSTPYLIVTDQMVSSMTLAAARGVDVRIITPAIPDKKYTFAITRSHYRLLVKGGVRIYEYTPGFIHAKQCVSDDMVAVCGTINLDYRSLYHHFEDGVLMIGCSAVADIRKDFESLFPQCQEVTEQYREPDNLFKRLGETLLHFSAPLF